MILLLELKVVGDPVTAQQTLCIVLCMHVCVRVFICSLFACKIPYLTTTYGSAYDEVQQTLLISEYQCLWVCSKWGVDTCQQSSCCYVVSVCAHVWCTSTQHLRLSLPSSPPLLHPNKPGNEARAVKDGGPSRNRCVVSSVWVFKCEHQYTICHSQNELCLQLRSVVPVWNDHCSNHCSLVHNRYMVSSIWVFKCGSQYKAVTQIRICLQG